MRRRADARARDLKRETVCAPTRTFSSTVIVGKSSTFWNVRAIPSLTTRLGGVCSSDLPSKTTSPESSAVEPRDHVERRRLAGAVRPDQAEDRALLHLERDIVERDDAAEAQRGVLEREETHARCGGDSTDFRRASRGTPARAAPSSSGAAPRRAPGRTGVWLTARTMNAPSPSTSRTLMQPGACSNAPRKIRSPVSARRGSRG